MANEQNERHWTTTPPPTQDSTLDPHHRTDSVPADYRQVLGWGADLDPKNRPMVPAELPSDVHTARGRVDAWQIPEHKVHMSIEHPNLTPVFGVASPPRGLSGLLRDYAFRYGEGTNRHWMTLLIADRIDVIESTVIDALRGKPDNFVRERAWGAKGEYGGSVPQRNKATGIALAGLAAAVLVYAGTKSIRNRRK